jgi:hypothetical protein
MLINDYNGVKLLDLKHIHEYELCYEFYTIYFKDINFNDLQFSDIENIIKNQKIPLEYILDKLNNFDFNSLQISDIINIIKNQKIPLEYTLKKINDIRDSNTKTEVINKLFQYSPYIENLCNNYMSYINEDAFANIIDNNPYICMHMFKRDKYTEYGYYWHILHCKDIDIIHIIELIKVINNIKDDGNRIDLIYYFITSQIEHSETEFAYIIDNLKDVNTYLYTTMGNKKLSNTIIKKYYIPSFMSNTFHVSIYEPFISHPNVYLEDIHMLNIDLNKYSPKTIISNPNLPVPDIDQIIKYYDITGDGNTIIDNARITADMIDKFMCYNDWVYYTIDITRNPNMTQMQFERIIDYCENTYYNIYKYIDWLSVFNNTNISIKYIKHIFAYNTEMLA